MQPLAPWPWTLRAGPQGWGGRQGKAVPRGSEQGEVGGVQRRGGRGPERWRYLWPLLPGPRPLPGAGRPPAATWTRRSAPLGGTYAAAALAPGPARSPSGARPALLGTGSRRAAAGRPRHLQGRARGAGPRAVRGQGLGVPAERQRPATVACHQGHLNTRGPVAITATPSMSESGLCSQGLCQRCRHTGKMET